MIDTEYPQSSLRDAITRAYDRDETECVEALIKQATLSPEVTACIRLQAEKLVKEVRKRRLSQGGLDAFLYEYDLSSQEGIALMCLAESLLRIPDQETADHLLKDKLTAVDWANHAGQSESFWVNAATWGLMLTGKILSPEENPRAGLRKFLERTSMPILRKAVKQAMRFLGRQFVMGETIEAALKRSRSLEKKAYRFSYDMLGEAARTAKDADRYFESYKKAIQKIGNASNGRGIIEGPGISVKLSALHPRYEFAQKERVMNELLPRLKVLVLEAKKWNIGLTIDAEEADRLELSLDVIEAIFCDPDFKDWEGLGLAVQSYQKRAPFVIDWLIDLAKKQRKKWMIRLIKGAYWDTEIKVAQMKGLPGYPVFTRKNSTDVSFLACVKKIFEAGDVFYPQFATHNAYSLAAVLEMAGKRRDFEFQCLHGMGYTLYDQVIGNKDLNIPCRVYAPVGGHEDLLAYLVRRLLENGANTSFVNRIIDDTLPISEIIFDPVEKARLTIQKPHPQIPLPRNLYGKRLNSKGIDLTNVNVLHDLDKKMKGETPFIAPKEFVETRFIASPPLNETQIEHALHVAEKAFLAWDHTPVEIRAQCLEKAADLLEERMPFFMDIAIHEAGKTIPDAVAEVREAIDFCRYYAMEARKILAVETLPGPTGELNQLQLKGRGIIACISPWNFPLAIFMGQVTAALVTGNCVMAKPAAQTSVIAREAVKLLHEAGIPENVLHYVPGSGSVVGAKLVADQRVKGIVFTGSTETARFINQSLANRDGVIVPLIAETGGQNCMIVDSSALLEQVVADVVTSAFGSAGQRCSALRVLFIPESIADKLITMLVGAMAELNVNDPAFLSTDIGPVIDEAAKETLQEHFEKMCKEAKLLYQVSCAPSRVGAFFPPCVFELKSLSQLTREVFGPILHIVRYAPSQMKKVIQEINHIGYGLTFGIQSRIEGKVETACDEVRVGNIYVNRNMIGAVVGVQPFGGEGLSGTGPKAGGPHYLPRFCVEKTICINTTAAGGNASLLCLQD